MDAVELKVFIIISRLVRRLSEHYNWNFLSKFSFRMETQTPKEMRILLVGKSGSGKSSVANQLHGSKVFQVSANNGTKRSQLARRTLEDGGELVIVDTPGYCNIHLTEEETQKEIHRGMELLARGPHCVIFVFSSSERVTGDDIKRLKDLQSVFDIYKRGLAVFTGIDEIEDEGQTLEEYIQSLPQQFNEFLNRLGTSPIGVDSKKLTDTNSSSQIIQAIKSAFEKIGNSDIENSKNGKRKGDEGCISAVERKMARKDRDDLPKKTGTISPTPVEHSEKDQSKVNGEASEKSWWVRILECVCFR